MLDPKFIPSRVFLVTYDRILNFYSNNDNDPATFQISISSNSQWDKSYIVYKFTKCPTSFELKSRSGLNHLNQTGSWFEEPTFDNPCTSSNVGHTGVWVFDVTN